MKKIFIIAGEASGDFIGYKLIKALREKNPNISFSGIGGLQMESLGLKSIFPMENLSIMGFVEILKRIFYFKKLINTTVNSISQYQPDMLITIDSLGFNKRVAKKIKKLHPNIILVHYVAPTVWAWKPKRAKEISKIFHYLLCLFDFELKYFQFDTMKTYFVGHPIVESGSDCGNKDNIIKKYNLNINDTHILLMPGSRITEVSALLPIFSKSISILQKKHPNIRVIIPCVNHLYPYINSYCKNNNLNYLLLNNIEDKFDSYQLAKMAIVASGTASLELSLANIHSLVAYKVHPISAYIASKLIKIKFASIVNIISNKEIIKELIQENCNVDNIVKYVDENINNDNSHNKKQIFQVLHKLGYNNFIPSIVASDIIWEILNNGDKNEN